MDTKALRQKILDLAIRGKLVPQDPNDEPASVLLERIRAEKQQMVKDGKLKAKDIKNDTVIFLGDDNLHYEKFSDGTVKCIEDEIPFELPDGWEWIRLGVAFSHNTGKALNKSKTEGTMLTYITTSNLYWNRFEIDKLKSMPFTDTEVEKCTVRKGDLLVCEGGDIGRAAIWNYDDEIRIQNHIHRLRAYIELNIEFYYHVFYLYKLTDMISGKGIGIQGLSSNQLHSIPIPLPPIQEQHRIVDKLNELISLVEFIEFDKDDLQNTIQLTKSKILDLAIRGKLVPQNPDDEPASVLLDRIRAEKEELIKQGKIKRDKKESVIYKGDDNSYYEVIASKTTNIDDDLPFELPDGWEWCRLGSIMDICSSKRVLQSEWKKEGVPFYRAREIVKLSETGRVDNDLFISEEHYQNLKKDYGIPKSGDLMVSGVGTIGKVYIVCENDKFYYKDASVLCFQNTYNALYPLYAKLLIDSSFMQKQMSDNSKGTTVDTITISTATTYLCILPPINEQKRIADKVSQLFSLLDSIAENVN